MRAHRLFRSGLVVAWCVASPITALAANNWPTAAKPAPAVKPEPKPVAKSAPKTAAPAKAAPAKEAAAAAAKETMAPAVVKTSAPAVAPVAAAITTKSDAPSELKTLTELVTRQAAAIEALTKRLDAAEAPKAAPVAAAVVTTAPATPAVPAASAASAAVAAPVTPAAVAAPVTPAAAAAAPASAQIGAPRPAAPATRPAVPVGYKRWADLQQVSLGFRYRYIDNSAGVRTNDQGQNNTSVKARFKFDKPGHYAINAGLFSGASNTSSWNNTGMGTGDPARDLHLKQLYFSAAPVSGLEMQYGGLYVARGEGTEITTYDNDGYLTGQRVVVKRPKQLWFDEVAATQAYLGDAKVPDMWNRYQRLTESNYYQILFGKKVGKRVGVSADYTEAVGVPTWRSALGFKAPEMVVLDGARFEAYARTEDGPTPFGWALSLDKKVGRAAMSGGFASIDEHYGGLNGDYYNRGNRWFGKASANLFPMLSVTGSYTYALEADYAIANQERFDLVFTYDVLKTFTPAPRR
jgi:hypothetical protein